MTRSPAAGSGGLLFTVLLFSGTHAAGRARAEASVLGQSVGAPGAVEVIDAATDSPDPSELRVLALGSRYVAFLDTDDVWLPHRLELALAGLAQAPVTWCASRAPAAVPPIRAASEPGSVSTIALDVGVVADLGLGAAVDTDAVRRLFADPVRWFTRLAAVHEVVRVDAVGVLTGFR